MRKRFALLETRVARQMLALFLVCALLPTAVLAGIAYRHVTTQLDQQSRDRLREASKTTGMALIERLLLSEAELASAIREIEATDGQVVMAPDTSERLSAVAIARGVEPPVVYRGSFAAPLPELSQSQSEHLTSGRGLLVLRTEGTPELLVARLIDATDPAQGIAWGVVDLGRLWGDLQQKESLLDMTVLADFNGLVLSGRPGEAAPPELRAARGRGDLEWTRDGQRLLSGYWTVFLGYQWDAASWTVVMSEPRERVLAPIGNFTRTFVLVILIVLVVVFLLSNSQIRRRMQPLVQLQKGTQQISRGDFDVRVEVRTGDEFEHLAGSFNRMASDLGQQFQANARLVERLEILSWGTLAALARTIDANSPWTAGHSERVTQLSLAIGRELEVDSVDLDRLHRGGLLHDIGKVSIPPVLLDKPAKLTEEEMEIIRSHPVTGARILAPISVFSDILSIVRHHHEKFDGTGYPNRLRGDNIPYLARIVAVADVYDALVSDRPYRAGWTAEAALEYIQKTAGSHHDPKVVDAFTRLWIRGDLMNLADLPALAGVAEEAELEGALS